MNSGLGRCFGMGGLQGHHVFLWFAGAHNKRNHIFKLCFPSDHLFQHDLSEEGEMVSHTAMVSFSAMVRPTALKVQSSLDRPSARSKVRVSSAAPNSAFYKITGLRRFTLVLDHATKETPHPVQNILQSHSMQIQNAWNPTPKKRCLLTQIRPSHTAIYNCGLGKKK